VVTTVAADDLEGVPEAAFLKDPRDADRLAPEARGDAVPGLTSHRDSHDITGLNADLRITGVAPAPDANILWTASGPGIGHDMQSLSAQLNPHLSRLGHRRGLEQRSRYRQYQRELPGRQGPDLSRIVTTSEDELHHDPLPGSTLMREPHRGLGSSTFATPALTSSYAIWTGSG
jgi:hypothetical protein